jgi:hypothetical protein
LNGIFNNPEFIDQSLPYENKCSSGILDECSKMIKIIPDQRDAGDFETPISMLERAQKIAFLGFGYDKMNLDRLGIREILSKRNVMVYCSAYEMTDSERLRVEGLISNTNSADDELNRINWGTLSSKCLRFLRENPILW